MPTRDQERVWHRLRRLYRESINALVVVNDLTKLRTSAESVIDDGDFEPYRCIYLVLKRVFDPLSELGLSKRGSQETLSARDLFVQIERDLYERACLAYEHAYKVRIPQGKLESTSDDTGLAPLSQRQRNP